MIPDGYKETKIGLIPEDWEVRKLGEAHLSHKITQGPNPDYKIGLPDKGFRALKTKDLYDKIIHYNTADAISKDTFTGCQKSELLDEDILVAIVGKGSIGKSNIFKAKNGIRYIFTRALGLIRLNSKNVSPTFFRQYFQSYYAKKYFERGISGSTGQEVLQTSYLKVMRVPLPPLQEQRKIAEILTAVDDAIEKTDAIIKETQKLKKGLTQKLFTEGVGHTRFKETKIGRIPESWEVVQVGKICDVISSGINQADFETNGQETPDTGLFKVIFMKVSDMNLPGNEKFIQTGNIERFYDETFVNKTNVVPPNATIFPKRGAAIKTNKKRISQSHIVLDPNLMAIPSKDERKANNRYLFCYFEMIDISSIQEEAPVPQLNKKDINPFLIPLPPIDEQQEIAAILSEVDTKIANEQATKAELEQLKKGLSQVLLTGRIRVKV